MARIVFVRTAAPRIVIGLLCVLLCINARVLPTGAGARIVLGLSGEAYYAISAIFAKT